MRTNTLFVAKDKNIEKLFGVPIAINEEIELNMKEQYAWAFEIDPEKLEQLKTQEELEKKPSPPAK